MSLVRWMGCGKYVLIIDLLGVSLEDFFNFCSTRVTIRTTSMFANQMNRRIEYIQNKNLIQRDIILL